MANGTPPRHATITLSGSAQNVGTYIRETLGKPLTPTVRMFSFQPDGANGNIIAVGGAGVTTTDYGVLLEAGVTGVPQAPWTPPESHLTTNSWSLDDWWVIGTNNQKLHVLWVPVN